jgi:3-hydroxybutyrate dehydrogenase
MPVNPSPATPVAIVTGSTSGIGLGIATAFAQAGFDVMMNGLGEPAAIEGLRADLAARTGARVRHHPANMLDPAAIADMAKATEREFGRVDVLVNNAGIQHVAPVEEFPPEKWDQIIAINLSATFHATRAVMAGMAARGFGRIINVASAHGLVASPFKSAYVAAKHGVVGFTKAVALEHARDGVTCNAICPGYVLTPLVKAQIPDQAKTRGITEEQVVNDVLLAAQPTKQFVTVEQLGAFALFLAGDSAAQINGAILTMDGGWTAQ